MLLVEGQVSFQMSEELMLQRETTAPARHKLTFICQAVFGLVSDIFSELFEIVNFRSVQLIL